LTILTSHNSDKSKKKKYHQIPNSSSENNATRVQVLQTLNFSTIISIQILIDGYSFQSGSFMLDVVVFGIAGKLVMLTGAKRDRENRHSDNDVKKKIHIFITIIQYSFLI